jgi:hypothetical protein
MSVLTTILLGTAAVAAPDWSVHWSPRVDVERTVLGQAVRSRRQTTDVTYRIDAEDEAGFAHEFRDLDLPDVDGLPADTNSFVHRLTFAWQRRSGTLRLRMGVTVAVSSNALKQPGDLDFRDLRPAVGAAWRAGPGWLALYADDRLGRTLVYPGFELDLRPAAAHAVRLGFPETSWNWQMAPRWRSVAAVGPDGACWQVRDEQFDERRSEVCSRAWRAAWSLRWQATTHPLTVEAAVGRSFVSSLEYQLRDGRSVRIDVPSGAFYALRFGAEF